MFRFTPDRKHHAKWCLRIFYRAFKSGCKPLNTITVFQFPISDGIIALPTKQQQHL